MAKRSRWVEINAYLWNEISDLEACYVIQVNGITVYVGSTFTLRKRMMTHNCRPGYTAEFITPWGFLRGVGRIKVKYAAPYGESLMIEARLIRKLKPQFNIRGAGRPVG